MSLKCEITLQPDLAAYQLAQQQQQSAHSPQKTPVSATSDATQADQGQQAIKIKETIDIRTPMEIIHLPFRCLLLPPPELPGVLNVDRRPPTQSLFQSINL